MLWWGTTGCQLPHAKTTSSALVSGIVNVNHLQFRDRRVLDNILNNSINRGKTKNKIFENSFGKHESLERLG
jgi:hypothetical protein